MKRGFIAQAMPMSQLKLNTKKFVSIFSKIDIRPNERNAVLAGNLLIFLRKRDLFTNRSSLFSMKHYYKRPILS